MDSTPDSALSAVWLGRLGFAEALALQLHKREEVVADRRAETLYLVEHPPVLTVGRRGDDNDILWPIERRAAMGLEVCETPRGGEVTLHAPGQLVAYPVVYVGRGIRAHIVRLGEVSATLCRELGVESEFRMSHPGLWVGSRKLASVGIHISRGVAVQGVSVNLDVDPAWFGALVSCGLRDVEVTSVTALGGQTCEIEAAARRWAEIYAASLGRALVWAPSV